MFQSLSHIKVFSYSVIAVSLFLFSFCHQGVTGHVYYVTGNRMPSPDIPASKPRGVKTVVYIYSLTNIKDVTREGVSSFYSNINTDLIKKIETRESGYFKIKLKPGMYSLFVKKGDLFFSNQFDDKNNISPVEVKAGEMTDVVFNINYAATY